jgi:hypothetical protein
MRYYSAILFALLFNFGFCQSSELVFLRGKITSSSKDLKEVNVNNQRSDSSTITDEKGDYSLFVKVGDTLKFSSVQIETKSIVIKATDLTKSILVTTLIPKVIALDEVEIKDYKNINAVSLGILQKPAKEYTPAERRLSTATRAYPTLGMGNFIGFSSGLDPVLNWMTGRTTMLKKELTIEKKEFLLQKIANQFDDDYFITTLKIPKEYIKGFCDYAVEDEKLATALNSKNNVMATFILTDLSKHYLEMLKDTTK